MKAVLFDFSGVVADIRMALASDPGDGDYFMEIHESVIEAISLVHRRGLRTALITNNNREAFCAEAPDLPLDEWFDVVVFSSDIGIDKPDPRIFNHVLTLLALKPKDVFFFDDLARNVDAAAALGIQGHVVDRPDSVLPAVQKLLAHRN